MPSAETVYIAVGTTVWAIPKFEFKQFLAARARGQTEDAGDLDRVGDRLVSKFTPGKGNLGGFPRTTVNGVARHDITGWGPRDYQQCLKVLLKTEPPKKVVPLYERDHRSNRSPRREVPSFVEVDFPKVGSRA
jgi:hypothetical protein